MATVRDSTRCDAIEASRRRVLVVSPEQDTAAAAFAREVVARVRGAHHLVAHEVAERIRTPGWDCDAVVLGGSADPGAAHALAGFVARARGYLAARPTACFLLGPWPREQDAVAALDTQLARMAWRPELGVAFPAVSSRYGILVRWCRAGRGERPLALARLADVERFATAVEATAQRTLSARTGT